MSIQTDPSWEPARHRAALATLDATNDNAPKIRKARSERPRHADLAMQAKSILTWRSARSEIPAWTQLADNDNVRIERLKRPLKDSTIEMRPRVSELLKATKDVKLAEFRHNDGKGSKDVIPVGEAVVRGPVLSQRGKPPCIVSLGGKLAPDGSRKGEIVFSNGRQTERVPVRTEAGIQMGVIRIPLGGIVRVGSRKVRDRFGKSKGPTLADTNITVGIGGHSSGAIAFEDPIEKRQEAERILALVPPATARILDTAIRSAKFADIGVVLGFQGKTAERRGKQALLEACAELDKALAA